MSGTDRPALPGEQTSHSMPPEESPAVQGPGAERPGVFRSCLFGLIQQMFLLLGLYVLSFGPMYWHWYGGRFAEGSELIAAFYEPLFILGTLVPGFGEWMDWYVGLWIS